MIEQTPEAFACPALILHGSSDKLYSAQGVFAWVVKLACDITISRRLLFEGKWSLASGLYKGKNQNISKHYAQPGA